MVWYFLLLTPIPLCACTCNQRASEVDPDVIIQNYSVGYDGEMDKTNVRATFDPHVILDGGAKVTHDAYALTADRTSFSGSGEGFRADHVFEYTDTRGKIFRNTIHIPSIELAPGALGPISLTEGGLIPIVGNSIEKADELTIWITQLNASTMIECKPAADPKELSVPVDNLKGLAQGEATIKVYLYSRRDKLEQATPAGGTARISYTSKSRKIMLIP
jgi:hypothetical protein